MSPAPSTPGDEAREPDGWRWRFNDIGSPEWYVQKHKPKMAGQPDVVCEALFATLPPVEEAAGVPRGAAGVWCDASKDANDFVLDLYGRATAARMEPTATALGDAIHFEKAAILIASLFETVRGARRTLSTILAQEEATRQSGPTTDDLDDISNALDRCLSEADDEIKRIDIAMEAING